jgi:hypothetical protein
MAWPAAASGDVTLRYTWCTRRRAGDVVRMYACVPCMCGRYLALCSPVCLLMAGRRLPPRLPRDAPVRGAAAHPRRWIPSLAGNPSPAQLSMQFLGQNLAAHRMPSSTLAKNDSGAHRHEIGRRGG